MGFKKLLKSRFGGIAVLLSVMLLISFITRIILLTVSFREAGFHILDIAKSFAVGLVYDIATFSYIMLPFVLIIMLLPARWSQKKYVRFWVYSVYAQVIIVLVFTAFAEYFFWDEFGTRFNFIAVDYLIYTQEVVGNIVESYPLPLLISVMLLISGLITWIIFKKKVLQNSLDANEGFKKRAKMGTALLVMPLVAILFINSKLSEISHNPYTRELAKNGIYSFFEALKDNQLDYNQFYITTKPEAAFDVVRNTLASDARSFSNGQKVDPIYQVVAQGEEQKFNVVLITVESLSGEYMSYIGNKNGIETPFLDSLANNSLFFANMYANGTRTVRGLEAINLSLPPTPGASIVRRPGNENLYSLGNIFKSKGYVNKFIYGGFGYFDNMNHFFENNGFQIVDRSLLSDKEITFANVWGVCDQDIFRRAIHEADLSYNSGKPFLNYILTTSNHRPYTFPETGVKYPKTREGGVEYTDFALRCFFNEAKTKPWFKNTIFVVVADHCGGSAGRSDLPVREYQIPCIIYSPENIKPQIITKLCSQIDVTPTLLAIQNWSYKSAFFGKDVLRMKPEEERAFIGNYQKLGFIRHDTLAILSPQKLFSMRKFDPKTGNEVIIKETPEIKKLTTAYYQSAEYIFMNQLNKFK
jgi:phosphoglycerol transferase MdoB-like AlkP superfamily enzyme